VACLSADNPTLTGFTPDERLFVIDTGASITITNDSSNFPKGCRQVHPVKLQGIASGLVVQGIGTAVYHFKMDNGSLEQVHLTNVLYVPGCPIRLLCPRHVVLYHNATGLPFVYTALGICTYHAFLAGPLTSLSEPHYGANLTLSQRANLVLQECFNHVSMKTLSQWIRNGILAVDKSIANCDDPICRACQFGKAHKRLLLVPPEKLWHLIWLLAKGLAQTSWRQAILVECLLHGVFQRRTITSMSIFGLTIFLTAFTQPFMKLKI
jgi:hypothetical protein